MKFEEKSYIDFTDIPRCFIYFLIDGEEVVYVGQTTKGLSRIEVHRRNKKFDKVYAILCEEEDLDYCENTYILKYAPKYNKLPNMVESISLKRVVSEINHEFGRYSTNSNKILKMLSVMGVQVFKAKQCVYISYIDWVLLRDAIKLINSGGSKYGKLDKLFYMKRT